MQLIIESYQLSHGHGRLQEGGRGRGGRRQRRRRLEREAGVLPLLVLAGASLQAVVLRRPHPVELMRGECARRRRWE